MKYEKIKKKSKIFTCDKCGRNDFINGHALGGHKKYCLKPEYYSKKILKRKIKRVNNFVQIKKKISKKKSEKKPKNNIVNVNKEKFNINIDELYENLFGSTDDLLNDYNKFKFHNEKINYEIDDYNILAKELGF